MAKYVTASVRGPARICSESSDDYGKYCNVISPENLKRIVKNLAVNAQFYLSPISP